MPSPRAVVLVALALTLLTHAPAGLVFGGVGVVAGNAATRIQALATTGGQYAMGVLPEVQDLYERQARELDRKKREELLHQIQRVLHDKVVFAPIWENGFIRGVGPRVEEPALALIPYSRTPRLTKTSASSGAEETTA